MTRDGTDILGLNAFGGGIPAGAGAQTAALIARRERSFGAGSVLFYREPLHIVRAEGAWLHAADGRRYLDFYNNVPTVGHSHPHVVEAVCRQLRQVNTHSRYLHESLHDYAERLLATLPARLANVVFTCTGSEANDLALRIAKKVSGSSGFIVTEAAYHGNTAAVTEISPSSYKRGGPPSYVRTIPAPDPRLFNGDLGPAFAEVVRKAAAGLAAQGIRPAALIVDSIFSSDGVFADPPGFLAEAVEAAREAGALFIADEVQPGFGRTGSGLWGFARHGVEPDIVTMGKPMGNGYPIAAMVTRPELLSAFAGDFGYFNTFAASPAAAAAGLAVLDVIEAEGLIANAAKVGAHLGASLAELRRRRPVISDIRGTGLYWGVEFSRGQGAPAAADIAATVINGLRDRGILIGAAGRCGDTLKIRPPLCVTMDDADALVTAMDGILSSPG